MADPPSPDARLPAHLEVSALLRQVQAEGGFATVIARGEREAGTLMVVITEPLKDRFGRTSRAYERMPQADGTRSWTLSRTDSAEEPGAFAEWVDRRHQQDPDLWIIELDIPEGERFIGMTGSPG